MAGYADLPPIWEEADRVKGSTEGIYTFNQVLMRGITSCQRFFGVRDNFSVSLPLLKFVNNALLMNPPLGPAYAGED